MVIEKTVVEGILFERFTDKKKTVVKGSAAVDTINKNCKLLNWWWNGQELKTFGKNNVQTVRCFTVSAV